MWRTASYPNISLQGFSLIEMLVVLTIVSILSAMLMPRYRSFIERANRQKAAIALTQLAARLENYYSYHQSYRGASLKKLHMTKQLEDANYRLNMRVQNQHYHLFATPLATHANQPTLWLNDAQQYGCLGSTQTLCWR